MARGWEKEDAGPPEKVAPPPLKTVASKGAEERERQRKLQQLQMQRERILSERTSSPHRRSALEAALLEVEEQLARLGWTLRL